MVEPLIDPNPQIQEQPQISVSEEGVQTPPSEFVATNRANKYTIGSPKSPVDNRTALDMLMQGREEDLRKQAASQKDFDNTVQQQRAVNEIAKKQGPLTLPQTMLIRDIVKRKQADPKTVIEENYAEEFMNNLKQTAIDNPDGELAQALKQIPGAVARDIEAGTDYRTKKEILNTLAEKANAAYENQSWASWSVDMLKGLTAVYGEVKLRGQVPGMTGFMEGPLGENLTKQWSDLMAMPMDEFKVKAPAIVDKLIQDNPSLAVLWTSAGQGLSNEDKFLLNFFPLLDLTLVGDVTKLGVGAARKLALVNASRKIMQEVSKDTEAVVSKASIKEAVGDIPQAAVEQFSTEVVTKGTASTVINDLQSLMRSENLAVAANAVGPMGPVRPFRAAVVDQLREVQNIRFGNFMTAVEKMMKVEQLPAVLAIPRVARLLAQEMEQEFRGLANTIADTRLIRDIATGQWFANFTLTRSGGKLFNTVKEAQNYARSLGLGEVKVAEAYGPPRQYEVPVTGTKTMSEKEAFDIFNQEKLTSPMAKGTWDRTLEFNPDFIPSTENKGVTVVKQKGPGFYLEKIKPVPIDSEFTRALMIVTDEQKTPNSILNGYSSVLGSTRTPEETMALSNIINRKIATYGSSIFNNVFKDLHQDIKELKGWQLPYSARREKWKQWKDVMSWMENVRNPETGAKGVKEAFSTPGELRDIYTQRLGRPPDDQEIKASFSYRTQLVLKEQLEKYTKLKNQLREGATHWTFEVVDPAFETKTAEGNIKKVSFSGIHMNELPTTGTVLIMRDNLKQAGGLGSNSFRNAAGGFLKETEEAVKTGSMRVVRLVEPDENPLLGAFNPEQLYNGQPVGNLRITHVISGQLTDKSLTLDHIKVNPSNNHDYDHYIVQPRIRHNPVTDTHEYLGDHTIAGFNIRAMSKEIADNLDKVRILIKDGKDDLAKEFYDGSTLPMEWQEIKNWFKPDYSAEVMGGRLSLDQRIHTVPGGRLSNEVDKDMERRFSEAGLKFIDRTKETYGQLGLRDPYDIFSLSNRGTKSNPEWAVAPTKFIDPVTSINRSLVKVINDVHLNDYKVQSIEHWIQEAKDLLDVKDGSLASAPAYWFNNPRWLPGLSGPEAIKANNLMTSQMQIKQFLGVRDANTTFLHNTAQILADSIYTKFGEKPYMLAMADQLPSLRDPFRFIRSVTFNAKLGLFAPAQLIVQMQNFALMGGIAGWGKAESGSFAFLLHTWSRMNRSPEIMEALDRYATSKLGRFRPGEFKEAHDLLTSTGFEHVAGEHGYIDSTTYHDLIGGPAQTFLNAGQWFFREGERSSRTAAFYTAYKEFRDANPIKKLTEQDSRTILQRADLLTSNMSRASSSSVQKGIWSLPTQFVSYTIRQAELMMGKRLTAVEKARLFGTYASLYGIPAALGSFTLGVGGELANTAILKTGYVSEAPDNALSQIMIQGMPAFLGQVMTGNLYNIGQRYAGGSGPVTDLLRSDKSVWEIMGGASGSTIYNSIVGMDGLWTAVKAAVKGEGPFAIKPEDFIDPFKQATIVNATWKLYMALQTGKWLSTKEMEMGDASPLNALFMAATGLSYQSATDVGTISHEKKVEKEAQAYGLQKFVQEWRRGIREFDKNNPEQGHDYWRRAFTRLRISGYPEENWPKAIAIASEGEESLVQRIKLDYYLKNVPQYRKDIGWESMQKYMKTQGQQK